MGFLEFRDVLFPASGFQSVQFRKIENTLGLTPERRMKYGKRSYCTYLSNAHAEEVVETEQLPNIQDLLEQWLERMPFIENGDFLFGKHYAQAVEEMRETDAKRIEDLEDLTSQDRASLLEELESKYSHYAAVYDEEV